MRIWSIHPKYLDNIGLIALWRETLLAKHVLEGKTKGYKNHPQLERFKLCSNPIAAINIYLEFVYNEALERGYSFDKTKFKTHSQSFFIQVTTEQVEYEFLHLIKKLTLRNINKLDSIQHLKTIELHPLFKETPGEIEKWEKINNAK